MFQGSFRFSSEPGQDWADPDSVETGDHSLHGRVAGQFSALASSGGSFLFGKLRLDNVGEVAASTGLAAGDSPASLALAALERFGLSAIGRFEGEFSLALWDRSARRLTLFRDALGRRPLFVAHGSDRIDFGSSAQSLARQLGEPRADIDQLVAFSLQRGQPGMRSMFTGVERIDPGGLVEITADGIARHRLWWQPDFSPTPLGDDDLLDALEQELVRSIDAIQRHYPNHTAHLSAGLDSSLAVMLMSRRLPLGSRLRALCASPARPVLAPQDEAIGDEYPLAQQTADMLGNVDVERVTAADDDWIAVSDRFANAAGMPYANQGNLGWLAASYARTRALGADALIESTQGNVTLSWQGKAAIPTLLRQGRFGQLRRHLHETRALVGGTGLMAVPWALYPSLPPRAADAVAALVGFPDIATTSLLRREHPAVRKMIDSLRRSGQYTRLVRAPRRPSDRIPILHWGDTGSHIAGVEQLYGVSLCDPFAAKRLVELTLRIEDPRFLSHGYGRRFARDLLQGHVPDQVASGRIDWQQGVDWRGPASAMRETMLADLDEAGRDADLGGVIDIPRARSRIEGLSKGAESIEAMVDGAALMRVIAVIRFARLARSVS